MRSAGPFRNRYRGFKLKPMTFVVLCLLPLAVPCHADGIDITAFVMHYTPGDAVPVILGKILLLMGINYALNYAVIALPATLWLKVDERKMPLEIGKITLWGQVTDRLGILLAVLLLFPVAFVVRELSLPEAAVIMVFLTFFWSGLGFYLVCCRYLVRRWGVTAGPGKLISLVAAIVCNPVWLLLATGYFWNWG